MFSFFKKKTEETAKIEEKTEKEAGKNEMKERMEREIAIHTMPERFRLDSHKATQAKTTGIVVMIVGVIFIIILAVLLYLFIFKGDNADTQIPTENETVKEKNQIRPADQEEATGGVLPIENRDDVPSATTTPEEFIEEATSTPSAVINSFVDFDNDG
jgi:Na+-transporting methylmalonyl-CoA/oxaloacetate decarboxylase gamma subunit